jgi:hypothetical protein
MIRRCRNLCAVGARPLSLFVMVVATGATALAQAPADPNAVTHLVNPVVFPEKDRSYTITIWIADPTTIENDKEFRLIFDDAKILIWCGPNLPKEKCDAIKNNKIGSTIVVGREVILTGIPKDYGGSHKVWLQSDDQTPIPSGAGMALGLSLVGRWTPVIIAGVILVALVLIVLGLLYYRGRPRTLPSGKVITLAEAIFVDTETSTYSLSKLQFYVWTFAGLGGYLYLSVAKSLVQGSLVLSDVPSNLPGIILISVGTAVVATGVSTVVGNKGAGDPEPAPSDLITSGGVVAPERLQYLLWTIVGGFAFFFYALAISPAEIQNLPEIPTGFLQLMGISAAGYVGGKIVRGPGPRITAISEVVLDAAPPAGGFRGITLTVEGTNLASAGATFFMAVFATVDAAAPGADVQVHPDNLPPQAAATYSTKLRLRVPGTQAFPFAPGTKYRFTIVNPDGEKASWDFTTPP